MADETREASDRDDIGDSDAVARDDTDDGDAVSREDTDDNDAVHRDDVGDDAVDRARDGHSETNSVPEEVVSEAERLTRLAENAAVEDAAEAYRERREQIVDEHDFTARVREADDTLVLYPEEWVDDGVVRVDRVEDTDRAVEVSLSGPDHGAEWEAVEAANAEIVDRVTAEYGADHAANVRAFADFMANHYLKRVDDATQEEKAEFLTEYYPRNAWPTPEQAELVEESLALVAEVTDDRRN